jgi:Tfp pilus assembly ATPase PilU
MPRFFFHIRGHDQSLSLDELGVDLPDAETACAEALCAAQDLEGVFTVRGQDPRDYAIQIENASGELVVYLSFSEIFDRCRVLS